MPNKTDTDLPERLMSLDAYRGFTMLAMASGGLGLAHVAASHPDSQFWKIVEYQTEHAPWVGCTVWDLIQPSFMFMVGVALAYSCAARWERGQSYGRMLGHAVFRALFLILLGVFLRSNGHEETQWRFDDVVSQIGLGYVFLFLLWNRGWLLQLAAFTAILVGYWCVFAYWPLPGPDFDFTASGADPGWEHYLTGFAAHWNKGTNPAQAFDEWFLNLFPRSEPFKFNDGGYVTLSFVPSLATMILGLLAGGLLKSELRPATIIAMLVVLGIAGLAGGHLLGVYGVCPVVKRIWTPSWVLFSGGWALLLLAFFCTVIDVWGCRWWAFPGVVTGMNSITIYVMSWLSADWIIQTIKTHAGQDIFTRAGAVYTPMLQKAAALLVMWLVLLWMYRKRIFVRI